MGKLFQIQGIHLDPEDMSSATKRIVVCLRKGAQEEPSRADTYARKKAEEEALARKKAEQEALARKKVEEEEVARKKAEEEALARKKEEEEA
jgi:hypothetical protein